MKQRLASLLQSLELHGLLLQQDAVLPDVASAVAGARVRGSWWSHPEAQAIFECLGELRDHSDVLFTKLVARKVTLVHRRLWPAFVSVATARAPWQWIGLSSQALALLTRVERESKVRASGPIAKELELRLLVVSHESHSDTGRHVLVLQSWKRWGRGKRLGRRRLEDGGRQELEAALQAMGGAYAMLPWVRKSR